MYPLLLFTQFSFYSNETLTCSPSIQVLQLMLPLRYDFLSFGGSWTQRQVFCITIIYAAVKADKLPLALSLVAELKVTEIISYVFTI